MKPYTLFVNDHLFFQDGSIFYSQGGLPASAWERYLEHFDHVKVIARRQLKRTSEMALSSKSDVTFNLSDHYTTPPDELIYMNAIDRHLNSCIKNADSVIIRLPSILGFRAISICKNINKPYAIEVVGCPRDTYWNYGSFFGKLLSPIMFIRMRKAVANSKFSVYVTTDFLQKRYPSFQKSVNISNVIIDKYPLSVLTNHISLINLPKDKLRFGMIGNIETKYKGYEVLFRALSKVKSNIPSFEVILVGGGNSRWVEGLSRRYGLQNNLKVCGVISSRDEMNSFLDSLDLYIHPSITEGLPRAMIEAMSRGCPVLSSNAGGIPELIKTKYQHSKGNYRELGKQLIEIINNNKELTSMASTNFYKAQEYSQEILQTKLFNFWKNFSEHVILTKRSIK